MHTIYDIIGLGLFANLVFFTVSFLLVVGKSLKIGKVQILNTDIKTEDVSFLLGFMFKIFILRFEILIPFYSFYLQFKYMFYTITKHMIYVQAVIEVEKNRFERKKR